MESYNEHTLNQYHIMGETEEESLILFWQPAKDGIRLLRVLGNTPCLILPEAIEGQPITEIGAYCFSQSERELPADYNVSAVSAKYHLDDTLTPSHLLREKRISPEDIPSGGSQRISGRFVESITLPSEVTTLHNAAFYNCRNLHTLSAGALIHAIGSDEFTNCSRLTQLFIRGKDSDKTGLSLILERIETDLKVYFRPGSSITGALFFPEYYEWLDEISPAHIFSRSIHGEGFRMRKCFENQIVDYKKYDQCFENALAVESEKSLCQIALARLRWPNQLDNQQAILYENTLRNHLSIAVKEAISNKDLELLLFLCNKLSFQTKEYTQTINACTEADWAAGAAGLMEEKHKHSSFAAKTFDFDDF